MLVMAGLAAFKPATTFAQSAKERHYYAPTHTIVQRATAPEVNEFKQGDFYAPVQTVTQQPTAQELKQTRGGDFCARHEE